jgi:hypothetical protein
MAGVFRLRGVDVHRVLRCAQVGGQSAGAAAPGRQDPLLALEELSRRLAACRDYEDATAAALDGLDDLFGFAPATLLVREPGAERLFAVSGNGHAASAGAEVAIGEGVIGTAASTGQVICVPNLARSRVMQAALREQLAAREGPVGEEIPLPGLPGAQSVAAVPIEASGAVTGVLYLESERSGAFGPHNQRLLRVVGRHLGAVLSGLGEEAEAAPAGEPQAGLGTGEGPAGPTVTVTYYPLDDSVFVDDAYVIKGAAGRILWKMLGEQAASGRTEFTNRELRLDESLGLPAGANNLEARLLMLRKRLAGGGFKLELERVGRGRLELLAAGRLRLKQK